MEYDHPRFSELSARRKGPGAEHDSGVRPRPEKIRGFSGASGKKRESKSVNREDIVDFLSSLYKEKLDSRSVARYLVSLRGLYKFAMMEELVTTDPTENLESPKVRSSLPTYLRVDEVDKLLQAPDLATPLGLAGPGHAGGALFDRAARFRIAEPAHFGSSICAWAAFAASAREIRNDWCRSDAKPSRPSSNTWRMSRPQFARPASPPPHNQVLFLTRHRHAAQPHQHLEDHARLRDQAGFARTPHSAQTASQFCHAPARAGCGPAFGPAHAGPRGYFHDADLHARGRGALEADLQGASPARVKAKNADSRERFRGTTKFESGAGTQRN